MPVYSMTLPFSESPLQQLHHPLFQSKGVLFYVKRDDLIHPLIQGNKWRKLKYNLAEASKANAHTLLTFGGPYSNHIYATAATANHFGFKSIGIIRGKYTGKTTPTLQFAESQGMAISHMDRTTYSQKHITSVLQNLQKSYGDFYLIPEGGTNLLALRGVEEMVIELKLGFDYLATPCGTGGTLAGILTGLKGRTHVLGFSSLKGDDTLTPKVNGLTEKYTGDVYSNYQILFNYHFGGYAKITPGLIDFIRFFKAKFDIQLEPVYTGKMFYGLFDMIKHDFFKKGSVIVGIHTGGLQGLSGYPKYFAAAC